MNAISQSLAITLLTLLCGSFAFVVVQAGPGAAHVKGTATYRERIGLTPDAGAACIRESSQIRYAAAPGDLLALCLLTSYA